MYCFEDADNGGEMISPSVDPEEVIIVKNNAPGLSEGTQSLSIKGFRREPQSYFSRFAAI